MPTSIRIAAVVFLAAAASSVSALDFAPAAFYPAGQIQEGVAVGDLDGDGDSDLAVIDRNSDLRVLFNNGNGAFPTSLTFNDLWPATTSDIDMADLDRDGDNDLAVAFMTIYGTVSILLNNGDGTFATPVNYDTCYSTQAVAIADLNGDFHRDTASASNCFQGSILLNDGHGTFLDNGDWGDGYVPSGIHTGDLDGDGDREVAFTNGTSDVTILYNDGTGSFPVMGGVSSIDNPQDVRIADFDGDGDNDLVSTNFYSDDLHVFFNDGAGNLAFTGIKYRLGDGPEGMDTADLDLDGDVDAAVANRLGSTVSFALNNGSGSFATRIDRASGTGPEDVAAGDLNGDARPDVVASHWGSGQVAVYLNTTQNLPDADNDGMTDGADCAAADPTAWQPPSTVVDLLLSNGGATTLDWSAPARPGTAAPRYDLLRATSPTGFQAATCLVSNTTSRNATDPQVPEPGVVFHYLIRTRNACGVNLGASSDGTPRQGVSCPG